MTYYFTISGPLVIAIEIEWKWCWDFLLRPWSPCSPFTNTSRHAWYRVEDRNKCIIIYRHASCVTRFADDLLREVNQFSTDILNWSNGIWAIRSNHIYQLIYCTNCSTIDSYMFWMRGVAWFDLVWCSSVRRHSILYRIDR